MWLTMLCKRENNISTNSEVIALTKCNFYTYKVHLCTRLNKSAPTCINGFIKSAHPAPLCFYMTMEEAISIEYTAGWGSKWYGNSHQRFCKSIYCLIHLKHEQLQTRQFRSSYHFYAKLGGLWSLTWLITQTQDEELLFISGTALQRLYIYICVGKYEDVYSMKQIHASQHHHILPRTAEMGN